MKEEAKDVMQLAVMANFVGTVFSVREQFDSLFVSAGEEASEADYFEKLSKEDLVIIAPPPMIDEDEAKSTPVRTQRSRRRRRRKHSPLRGPTEKAWRILPNPHAPAAEEEEEDLWGRPQAVEGSLQVEKQPKRPRTVGKKSVPRQRGEIVVCDTVVAHGRSIHTAPSGAHRREPPLYTDFHLNENPCCYSESLIKEDRRYKTLPIAAKARLFAPLALKERPCTSPIMVSSARKGHAQAVTERRRRKEAEEEERFIRRRKKPTLIVEATTPREADSYNDLVSCPAAAPPSLSPYPPSSRSSSSNCRLLLYPSRPGTPDSMRTPRSQIFASSDVLKPGLATRWGPLVRSPKAHWQTYEGPAPALPLPIEGRAATPVTPGTVRIKFRGKRLNAKPATGSRL